MPDKEILDSWKEIASYLGRSEKTCRRFERDLGLPVRRLEETPRARVFAYKEEIDRWIDQTKHSETLVEKGIRAEFGGIRDLKSFLRLILRPKLVISAALLAIAAIILFIVISRFFPKQDAVSLPADRPSLAVLYFKNNTGEEECEFWREALSDSIITDLHQSRHIRVLGADHLLSVLKKLNLLEASSYSIEDVKAVADEAGVDHILQGSLAKAGDAFRIEYVLSKIPSGKIVGSDRMEGEGLESIFSMIDELSKKVKADLNLTRQQISEDLDREIGDITTGFTEAFKYYIEGRKFHLKGEYQKSISVMKRAVSIDPEFAMAYWSLSRSCRALNRDAESTEYLKKAFELSGRLPDRERFMIQGDFYRLSDKTYDKAIEAYEKLIKLYPDTWLAYEYLAWQYAWFEKWDRAIELMEVVTENNPNPQAFVYLALYKCYKGKYADARKVLQNYIDDVPDNVMILLQIARTHVLQRDFDRALEQVEAAFLINPTDIEITNSRGWIYLFKGDVEKAEEEFSGLQESNDPMVKALGRAGLMYLYNLQGKFRRSLELYRHVLNTMEDLGHKRYEFYLYYLLAYHHLLFGQPDHAVEHIEKMKTLALEDDYPYRFRLALCAEGEYHVETGSLDKAGQAAKELKGLIEEGLNAEIELKHYYGLMGRIEHKQGNHSLAIEYYEKGLPLFSAEAQPDTFLLLFLNGLAEVYFEAGNWERAREAFEEILRMTYNRYYFGALYAKSFYMLGRICEEKGDTTQACEYYQKFLALWKEADSGILEVEDVKRRLATLMEN